MESNRQIVIGLSCLVICFSCNLKHSTDATVNNMEYYPSEVFFANHSQDNWGELSPHFASFILGRGQSGMVDHISFTYEGSIKPRCVRRIDKVVVSTELVSSLSQREIQDGFSLKDVPSTVYWFSNQNDEWEDFEMNSIGVSIVGRIAGMEGDFFQLSTQIDSHYVSFKFTNLTTNIEMAGFDKPAPSLSEYSDLYSFVVYNASSETIWCSLIEEMADNPTLQDIIYGQAQVASGEDVLLSEGTLFDFSPSSFILQTADGRSTKHKISGDYSKSFTIEGMDCTTNVINNVSPIDGDIAITEKREYRVQVNEIGR